jgi:hypothetical protein
MVEVVSLLRCPECRLICGDDPDVEPTEDDGTAYDDLPCLSCVELDDDQADDYY